MSDKSMTKLMSVLIRTDIPPKCSAVFFANSFIKFKIRLQARMYFLAFESGFQILRDLESKSEQKCYLQSFFAIIK